MKSNQFRAKREDQFTSEYIYIKKKSEENGPNRIKLKKNSYSVI